MLRIACLASLVAFNEALLWAPSWGPTRYEAIYDMSAYEEAPPTTRWSASPSAYELKVRLPDLEPNSVKAALTSDGTKVEIIGERKIEHCTCSPSTVKEITLPYRPRAEDIDVSYDKDNVLSLKLARHSKVDAATPLTVTTRAEDQGAEERRPLRFVPHESATEKDSLHTQEKMLQDKFRSAALASLAVQRENAEPELVATSVKEAAAKSAELSASAESARKPDA